jgi:beta-phosphoglucomutase-like phosphatase (HAD superfamily)
MRGGNAGDVQAVIFDMDGVIVDSEPYSMQALIDVLRHYGIDPTEEDIRRSYGRRIRDDFRDYFSRYGVPAPLRQLSHKRRHATITLPPGTCNHSPG